LSKGQLWGRLGIHVKFFPVAAELGTGDMEEVWGGAAPPALWLAGKLVKGVHGAPSLKTCDKLTLSPLSSADGAVSTARLSYGVWQGSASQADGK
jgi:hypothetical protein